MSSFVIADPQIRSRLLAVAREAIRADLLNRPVAGEAADGPEPPNSGVFVTLRCEGQLRGCIGTFHPDGDLVSTIRRIAVEATRDSRFTGAPLSALELPRLRIELSLLSPLQRIHSSEEIEIGRHGIYVKIGEQRGCFLPSVATEHGWDAKMFLSRCCAEKMGVPPDGWRGANAVISVFEVDKIAEE